MGLALDFAGGAADAGAGIIGNQIRTDQATDAANTRAQFDNDLAQARWETQQKLSQQFEAQKRQIQTSAIQGQLAQDADLNSTKPAAPLPTNANGTPVDADGNPLTQEAIEQYNNASGILNSRRQAFMNDPDKLLRAKAEAGYGGEEALASNANKADIQAVKSDAYMQVQAARTDAMNAKTQAQYEAAMAKVEAAVAKAGSGNTDFDKKVKLLKEAGASPQEISNFIVERKQPSLEDLANGFLKADPQAGTAKAMTPDQAFAKAKQLRSLTSTVQDTGGGGAAATPANRPPLSAFQK